MKVKFLLSQTLLASVHGHTLSFLLAILDRTRKTFGRGSREIFMGKKCHTD